MIDNYVVLLIGLGYLVQGQDLGVGSISQADPFSSEGSTRNFDGYAPYSQAEATPSAFVQETSRVEIHENSSQQAKVPMASRDDLRVVPSAPKRKKKKRKGKKKKMRKVKVKPRGGRHIKDTYQDLRPLSMQNTDEEINSLQTTTQNVVIFEPIYDKSMGSSYTPEELLKLCHETENVSAKFGITDVSSFAGSNCALIQLYYPEVTCEQINVFLEYCQKANAHA